jgi:hypothetical protein
MNVWDWVAEFRAEALAAGDQQRLRLVDLNHFAYQHRYTNPDQMLALLGEGRRLAEILDEPWWTLFSDYWCIEAILTYKGDYRHLVDRAVSLTLEARKPLHDRHPLRFNIHLILVRAYLGVDPCGHARAIQEALDYLQAHVPAEGSVKYLLLFAQQAFAQELGLWERAREVSFRTLTLLDSEPNAYTARHYRVWGHAELCPVLHRLAEWDLLREFAVSGEELARQHSDQYEVARLLAWQALAARRQGDENVARRCLRLATATMNRLGIAPAPSYYTALCASHELGGQLTAAWQVRERQLQTLLNKGQFAAECQCRLERCRLLAQMGQPLQAELAAARQAAGSLRDPRAVLEQLDRLER